MTDSNSLFQIDVSPVPAGTRVTVPPTPLHDVPDSDSDYRKALSRRLDGTNRRTPPAENSSRDLRDAATQHAPRSPTGSQAEDQREASTDGLGTNRSSSAQQQTPGQSQPTGDSDDAGVSESNTAPANDRHPPQSETETQTGDAPKKADPETTDVTNTALQAHQHVFQSQGPPCRRPASKFCSAIFPTNRPVTFPLNRSTQSPTWRD